MENGKALIYRLDSAGRVAVFFLLIFVVSANVLAGAVHSNALRLENRLSWKASPGWDFRGSFQARFRDQFGEFYYRKLDAGACYNLNGRLKLPVSLRFEERVRSGAWFRSTYLLFDPTIVLASPGKWRLDVRTRLQYLSDENSLHYIRIQPRIWRSFDWRGLGWWIYNDFYIRLADTGTGTVTNYQSNNFSTGFKLPLSAAADLNIYYPTFPI